jgi:hypothetical protein
VVRSVVSRLRTEIRLVSGDSVRITPHSEGAPAEKATTSSKSRPNQSRHRDFPQVGFEEAPWPVLTLGRSGPRSPFPDIAGPHASVDKRHFAQWFPWKAFLGSEALNAQLYPKLRKYSFVRRLQVAAVWTPRRGSCNFLPQCPVALSLCQLILSLAVEPRLISSDC